MGFIHRRTSKQTGKVKTLLGLALSRLAVARRPRLARKSISRGDVGQLLGLGHHDRALHRAEQVIEEENMLEAFDIIELYCKHLIKHAPQLEKPHECGEDIREAAAGVMFAAGWCGDLPELLFARTILANKFSSDFAAVAKEGTGIVDAMLVWKLSGDKTNMELKKKVVKEIAAENNIVVDFSELSEVAEQHGSGNVPRRQEFDHETMYRDDMDGSSESECGHSSPHRMNDLEFRSSDENFYDVSSSAVLANGQPKPKKVTASVRTRR